MKVKVNQVAWVTPTYMPYTNTVPEAQTFATANMDVSICMSGAYGLSNGGTTLTRHMQDRQVDVTDIPGHLSVKLDKADIPEALLATVTVPFRDRDFYTFLPGIRIYQVDGKDYYTQLDPNAIKCLGDVLDLSEIIERKTISYKYHADVYGRGDTANTEILTRLFKRYDMHIDEVGTVAILPESLAEKFKTKFGDVSIQALKTASLFKGATPHFIPDKQTPAQLASGGRFFLYSTEIEALVNGEKTTVPYIGLAVFGDERYTKYKNPLCLLEVIAGFLGSDTTVATFFPEKAKEWAKGNAPSIAQWWPGMDKWVKDLNSKALVAVDATALPPVSNDMLKIFFSNTALARTPEASRYLAVKAKLENIQKQAKDLDAKVNMLDQEIKELTGTVTADLDQIEALKARIKKSKARNIVATEELATAQPQNVRINAAVLEVLSQVKPLEADYAIAVSKYWDLPVDIETANNWANEGYVIRELVISDERGTAYNTPEKIKERVQKNGTKGLFISHLRIITTKPTLIGADAHKVGYEKAVKYVGGPYNIVITYSGPGGGISMSLQLLDDRSFRGMWKQEGYIWYSLHPHTAKGHVYESEFNATKWHHISTVSVNTCMGEFEPIAAKAMRDLNIHNIVYGLKGWLETADTNDSWASCYKHYPKATEVTVEKFGKLVPLANSKSIDEIAALFSKQTTLLKSNDEKLPVSFVTILEEGCKVIISSGDTTLVDETLTLVPGEAKRELLFINAAQRETAVKTLIEEYTKDAYVSYATAKNVSAPTLIFQSYGKTPTAPVVDAGPYNPVRATRQAVAELRRTILNEEPPEVEF